MNKKWLMTGEAIAGGQWDVGENQSKGVRRVENGRGGVRRKWVRPKQMILGED